MQDVPDVNWGGMMGVKRVIRAHLHKDTYFYIVKNLKKSFRTFTLFVGGELMDIDFLL